MQVRKLWKFLTLSRRPSFNLFFNINIIFDWGQVTADTESLAEWVT